MVRVSRKPSSITEGNDAIPITGDGNLAAGPLPTKFTEDQRSSTSQPRAKPWEPRRSRKRALKGRDNPKIRPLSQQEPLAFASISHADYNLEAAERSIGNRIEK